MKHVHSQRAGIRRGLAVAVALFFVAVAQAQTAPAITAISAPRQVVTLGQSLTLSVTATGTPTPTYQWKRNGLPIAGATATNYTITSAVTWRDNGWYQAVATNSAGSGTSAVVFVNVAVNPAHVLAWGDNTNGQNSVPSGLTSVVGLAAEERSSVALKADGTVIAWGDNYYGQTTVPAGLTNVVGVAAGYGHFVALKADGTVVAWGLNEQGQSTVPAGVMNVVSVAAGRLHTAALKADGTVIAWGFNNFGQSTVPAGLIHVVGIAAGGYNTVALMVDGTVVPWGSNFSGQSTVPTGANNIVTIAAGGSYTVALKADGTVLAWGSNGSGETTVPYGLNNVVGIAAGYNHTLAQKADGTIVAWGANQYGQSTVPAGLVRVVGLVAGGNGSIVLRDATSDTAPTITTQPATQSVNLGQTVTLSVGANVGTAPTTYQWRKNEVIIAGATAASYTIGGVSAGSAGSYDVLVSNYLGSVTSSAATLTVTQAPAFTSASSTVFMLGVAGAFNVTASGSPAPTFSVASGAFPSWASLDTATGAISGTPPNATGSPFAFSLRASNGIGSPVTQSFTLTVIAGVVIDDFQTLPFSVAARTDGFNVFYGYEPDPAHMLGGARQIFLGDQTTPTTSTASLVAGQGFMTYTLAQPGADMLMRHGANYDIRATGADTISIDLLQAPPSGVLSLRLIDQAQTVSATFSQTIPGPGTYTWQISSFLTAAPTLPMNSLYLDFYVNGAQGTYRLANFRAVHAVAPAVTTQPASLTIASGQPATLRVNASGTGTLTYQWYQGASGDTTTPISGATKAFYTTPALTATTSYWVKVTDALGSTNSSTTTVTVSASTPPISAIHAVVGVGYLAGSTVTITNTVTYTGSPSRIDWSALLPGGWSYLGGGGSEGNVKPATAAADLLEWTWTTVPASPFTFTYTLNVPAGTTGGQPITALVSCVQTGVQYQSLASVDPLIVNKALPHSADTNGDGRISLFELTRVIELYNHRAGTVRTGQYHVQTGTEDGFAPGP